MDNNNNNDFMSIFNDAHIDPNGVNQQPTSQPTLQPTSQPEAQPEQPIQNNPWVDKPKNTFINNDITQNESSIQNNDIASIDIADPEEIKEQKISNIVNVSQEQINEQILGQSEIIQSTGDINHSQTDEQFPTEVKEEESLNLLTVLIFGLIIGIVVFARFNLAEKYFSKPKDSGKTKQMEETIYNFEQSFSAYIKKINKTTPINNTIACVSEGDKNSWGNHPDFKSTFDCQQLINAYKQTDSAVEIPSYGIIYINENGIKNGTHFIYNDGYVCSYNSYEEKLFKCEKAE